MPYFFNVRWLSIFFSTIASIEDSFFIVYLLAILHIICRLNKYIINISEIIFEELWYICIGSWFVFEIHKIVWYMNPIPKYHIQELCCATYFAIYRLSLNCCIGKIMKRLLLKKGIKSLIIRKDICSYIYSFSIFFVPNIFWSLSLRVFIIKLFLNYVTLSSSIYLLFL